jgi:putative PIN family toxin of toxin-antitoxin system
LHTKCDSTYAITMIPVVIDTNVFVAALRSGGGASRQVLRSAIEGVYRPLFSNALWSEYEDLLARPVWTDETTETERWNVLAALAAAGEWVKIYYGWRPNLPDEGDNHLIELAVAGGARAVITHNVRDLRRGELRWENLLVLTPSQCLETLR